MPLVSSLPLAAAPSLGESWWRSAGRPSAAQLRTYVVLATKKKTDAAGKPRKPALSFLLPDALEQPSKRLARHSSRSSNSSSCSTAGSDEEDAGDDDGGDSDLEAEPADEQERAPGCLAYASYAAVAGRARSASLRWEDLDRRPRLDVSQLLSLAERQPAASTRAKKSAGSFRTPPRAARRAPGSRVDERRAMGVALALELSLEFLALDELQTASHTCRVFRGVVLASRSLLTGMYARQWRAGRPLPRAYAALPFADQLALVARQNADKPAASALSTRSAVEAAADGSLLVTNNSMLRSFARGSVDSVRGAEPLPWLACARALHKRVAYYEVSMRGCGSVGVAAVAGDEGSASGLASSSASTSASGYGFGSEAHVGWTGVSYGYHGNDGDFVFNDGSAAFGGEWKPFGPSWGSADKQQAVTIGCGLDADKRALFFTLDGELVGQAPVALAEPARYALAVSLHSFGDAAKLNLGAGAFLYDIEGYCASP